MGRFRSLLEKLSGGTGQATVIKLAAVVAAYALFAMTARVMSISDFGQFSFSYSLATLGALIAGLGLNNTILRFLPQYEEQDRKPLAAHVTHWTYRRSLLSALLASTLCIAGAILLKITTSAQVDYLVATSFLLGLLVMGQFYSGLLRAQGAVFRALFPFEVLWRAVLALCAAGSLWQGMQLTSAQGLWACVVTLGVVVVYQARIARITSNSQHEKHGANEAASADGWWKVSITLGVTSVLFLAPRQVDVVILGAVLGPETTGTYFAAVRTAAVLIVFMQAANAIGAPQIARAYHSERRDEVEDIAHRLVRAVAIQALPAFAVVAFLGDTFLAVFGPEYVSVHGILIVLAFSNLVSTLTGPTYRLLSMTGHEALYLKWLAFSYSVGTLLRIIVLLFTANLFHFACLSALTTIFTACGAAWLTRKHLGFDPSIFSALVSLRGK